MIRGWAILRDPPPAAYGSPKAVRAAREFTAELAMRQAARELVDCSLVAIAKIGTIVASELPLHPDFEPISGYECVVAPWLEREALRLLPHPARPGWAWRLFVDEAGEIQREDIELGELYCADVRPWASPSP